MKNTPNEIVELGKELEELEELVSIGLLNDKCQLWKRYNQVKRELAVHWNNLICD